MRPENGKNKQSPGVVESDFRKKSLNQDKKQIAIGILAWICIVLGSTDLRNIGGHSDQAFLLLLLRTSYILLSMIICFLVYFKVELYTLFDRLAISWALLSVSVAVVMNEQAGSLSPGRFIIDMIIILSLYLSIPKNIINRAVPALLFTFYELFSFWAYRDQYSLDLIRTVFFCFAAINLMLFFYSMATFSRSISQFALHADEDRVRCELQHLASTDPLTGVFNRRKLLELASEAFYRLLRYKRPFTILVMDLDGFKAINDTFGHQQGDLTLLDFCRTIQEEKREGDYLGRMGGDEFCLLLSETNEQESINLAERILRRCGGIHINQTEAMDMRVTVSIGIAEGTLLDRSVDAVFSRADKALYEAKNSGKNRMVVSITGIPISTPVHKM